MWLDSPRGGGGAHVHPRGNAPLPTPPLCHLGAIPNEHAHFPAGRGSAIGSDSGRAPRLRGGSMCWRVAGHSWGSASKQPNCTDIAATPRGTRAGGVPFGLGRD